MSSATNLLGALRVKATYILVRVADTVFVFINFEYDVKHGTNRFVHQFPNTYFFVNSFLQKAQLFSKMD